MLVISRFRYGEGELERARRELEICLETLAGRPGYLTGAVGRALDDPTLWLLQTSWSNVGAYRRALSSYDVKATAVPLLAAAVKEPSAYEVIVGAGADVPNEPVPRSL